MYGTLARVEDDTAKPQEQKSQLYKPLTCRTYLLRRGNSMRELITRRKII